MSVVRVLAWLIIHAYGFFKINGINDGNPPPSVHLVSHFNCTYHLQQCCIVSGMWLENAQTELWSPACRCVLCAITRLSSSYTAPISVWLLTQCIRWFPTVRGRATSVFLNTLACAAIVQHELVFLPLSFSVLTSILKPWMSGMPASCENWVALGNPGAFHSEQVTVVEVMRG